MATSIEKLDGRYKVQLKEYTPSFIKLIYHEEWGWCLRQDWFTWLSIPELKLILKELERLKRKGDP